MGYVPQHRLSGLGDHRVDIFKASMFWTNWKPILLFTGIGLLQ